MSTTEIVYSYELDAGETETPPPNSLIVGRDRPIDLRTAVQPACGCALPRVELAEGDYVLCRIHSSWRERKGRRELHNTKLLHTRTV